MDKPRFRKEKLSDKIIRNTGYNVVGRAWSVIIALVLTPYIIDKIGLDRFGIWSVVGVITGYFGLLDMGIGSAFVKYIAEFFARNEEEKINALINTGFFFYAIVAILTVATTVFLLRPALSFFNIQPLYHEEAVFVFWIGMLIFVFSGTFGPFTAVQNGLQRMDISNLLGICTSLFGAVGTIYFLQTGQGLRGLMINNAIIFAITTIANIIIAYRLLPKLRFRPLAFDVKTFRSLFSFGFKLQVSRLANLISFQSDKLLITHFLNLSMVTFYQLGSSVLQQVRQIPLLLISALIPAVSELDARREEVSLKELYITGSKYLVIVSVPCFLFMFVCAPLVMSAWMGKGCELSAVVIQFLAIGYLAATVTGVASSIALGVGRTDFDMKFGIFMATLNLCLNIILIIKIGFMGAVIGTTVSLTVASFYYILLIHRYLKCPLSEFFSLFIRPLTASFVPSMVAWWAGKAFLATPFAFDRMWSLGLLGVISAFFGVWYVILIGSGDYLSGYDKSLLVSKIPLLKFAFKRKDAA